MKPLLSVNKLNKFYDHKQVLYDINFDLYPGEVIAILGPSGSGKSTLLRTLNGLEKYQSGKIAFDQKEIIPTKQNWKKLRQKIGMVFQNYELFPNLKVIDNITLAPIKVLKQNKEAITHEAHQLLKQVGLFEYRNAYPHQLLGGQKQRIAIIRSLIMHPQLMLFDEVTASLDPEMVRSVLELMKQLVIKNNQTMIVVTHEMDFAHKVADRILFLENGHILEDTPSKQFFKAAQTKRAQMFLKSMTF